MANVRHASAVKPISIPMLADVNTDNWDRVQTFTPATTQPQEKLYEIGRKVSMATDKQTLEATLSITQLEYGKIDSFLQLAGLSAEPGSGLELSDFDDGRTDFMLPGKDVYGGTLEQTLWLEKMSLDSFELAINAEERLVRTFGLSGDFCKIARYANKYLIFKTNDAPSGTSGSYAIVLSDPAPVADPNNAGVYILKVVRIRSGVATELNLTTDYTWTNGTTTLTILSALTSDHFRIWFTAGSYGSSGDPTALNDVDDYYLSAENVTVTLDDGTHTPVELTKLTALSIASTLNRLSLGAIGTDEKIFRDVENYEVTIRLDGYVKDSTIQEILMKQAGQNWGIIDYSLFDKADLVVKVFDDANKTNFVIGYKVTGCEFSDDSPDYNANENSTEGISLAADNLLITEDDGNL
jgi:hypothetical protein